jgi:hypothetical protein
LYLEGTLVELGFELRGRIENPFSNQASHNFILHIKVSCLRPAIDIVAAEIVALFRGEMMK